MNRNTQGCGTKETKMQTNQTVPGLEEMLEIWVALEGEYVTGKGHKERMEPLLAADRCWTEEAESATRQDDRGWDQECGSCMILSSLASGIPWCAASLRRQVTLKGLEQEGADPEYDPWAPLEVLLGSGEFEQGKE
ncbi:hypothetical protein NDU88_004024 [Pleurodeles waltl]|uniref:Uncharacterized protein n=1 Tax=Pleurodeles waltl TaxID=8319 RepID=A0AAV7UFZ4_PLEWA|nr:hypothetical protein NDU88_004024 [Pleurodeles waltl]